MTDHIDRDHRLVAILRGIKTDEVTGVISTLIESGFRAIEIPLNSPDPIASIGQAVWVAEELAPGECLIGAGTVLNTDQVQAVAGVGGKLIVSPNCVPDVIRCAKDEGMISFPGVFTPTEAFTALDSGADGLKFFPASILGPGGIGAISAVLPMDTKVYAVGGVDPDTIPAYLSAGASGFGLGSNLYKPGAALDDIKASAARYCALLPAINAHG